MAYTKIVIVGGGFGGLTAAKALKRADVDVTLIDRTNHHLFQPLLYQVATASLSEDNIAVPIRGILRKQKNACVIMADVSSINCKESVVFTADGEMFPFDYLIVAAGAMHSYFGHPEWESKAPGLKTIYDAIYIREKILLAFEKAERSDSIKEAHKHLRFVIVGGGPTGVEMAGSIAETAKKTLFNNFRKINPELTEVYLIEGLDRILPSYPKQLSDKAKRDLEKMGVNVMVNTRVTDITDEGVITDKRQIETKNVIWAAGNQASPLLGTLGAPLDRAGRVLVGPDLSIPDYSNIFVIGDAANLPGKDGNPLPGIAPVAIQQGRYVAKIISKSILPEARKPFSYFDKGSMATIGRSKAVAVVGRLKFSGFFAWVAWSTIHILYLISFENRLLVLIRWMYLYFTGKRSARVIVSPIESTLEMPEKKKEK